MTGKRRSSSSSRPSVRWTVPILSHKFHSHLQHAPPTGQPRSVSISSTVTASSTSTHLINSQRNAVRVVFVGPCSDNPANAEVCKCSDSAKALNQVELLMPPRFIIIANVNITVTRYAGVRHAPEYPYSSGYIYRNPRKGIHRKEMRFVLTVGRYCSWCPRIGIEVTVMRAHHTIPEEADIGGILHWSTSGSEERPHVSRGGSGCPADNGV